MKKLRPKLRDAHLVMVELGFGYQPFDKIMRSTTKFWSFLWPELYQGLKNINLAIYSLWHPSALPCVCQPPSLSLLDTQTTYPSLRVGFQPWHWVLTNGRWVTVNKAPALWPPQPCTTFHFPSLACGQVQRDQRKTPKSRNHQSPLFLNGCSEQIPSPPRLHWTTTSKTRAFVAVSREDFEVVTAASQDIYNDRVT